jgi:hypothetical protein
VSRGLRCLAILLTFSFAAVAGGGMSFEYQAIEKKHPFSNTALLFAVDDRNLEFQYSNIKKVDGKGVGFMGPMRTSARVAPGTHKFLIDAVWDNSSSLSVSNGAVVSSGSARHLEFELEVKDMQPLHVYTLRYQLENDAPKWVVEDLGTGVEYWPSPLTRKAAF